MNVARNTMTTSRKMLYDINKHIECEPITRYHVYHWRVATNLFFAFKKNIQFVCKQISKNFVLSDFQTNVDFFNIILSRYLCK